MKIILSAISISIPLVLASLGGLFCELSGVLNIALEGYLLTGAFSSVIFAGLTGNIFVGIFCGTICTLFLGILQAWITLYLKANKFVAGLAINLLVPGLATVLSFHFFNNRGVLSFENIPKLNNYIFLGQNIFFYITISFFIISWFLLEKTPFGTHIKANGVNPKALESFGLDSRKYIFISYMICAVFCAIGGASLALPLGSYIPNISGGKGWMALVIIFLGNRNPLGMVFASLLFGFAEAFSNYAQGAFKVPLDFILAIPYIFTLIVMTLYSIHIKRKKNFKKEIKKK